jgi:flavin-dependent dehydrogenase
MDAVDVVVVGAGIAGSALATARAIVDAEEADSFDDDL